MKIKQEYVLKKIGNEQIVVPIKDEAIRFNGIITVNKTAAFLFEQLQNNDVLVQDLLKLVMDKYDIDESIAKKDIEAFISKCRNSGLLDE